MTEPNEAGQLRDELCAWIGDQINHLSKRGALIQLSGGIDSSTVLFLCARALGPQNVTALYLPDMATGPETKEFVTLAAEGAGVRLVERSIAASIEAQQPAPEIHALIAKYAPEYDPRTHAYSVNIAQRLTRQLGALIYQVAIGPRHGRPERILHVSVDDLRALIAYQNRKQRTRMLFAYAEAEAKNLAVVGCSNGDELDTGFVVKYGDDAADICPIGGLAKARVYELAGELGVPQQIIERPPTTDTYALSQTQEDYYYALPAGVLKRLVTMADQGVLDSTDLTELVSECPGWDPEALRQAGTGLAATIRNQRTRSLRYLP